MYVVFIHFRHRALNTLEISQVMRAVTMSFAMLMNDFWTTSENGLVARGANHVISGLELLVPTPLTSGKGREAGD